MYHRLHVVPSIISLFRSVSVPSPVFFFNDPATTEIYTLSLHDALPISDPTKIKLIKAGMIDFGYRAQRLANKLDRKSTRLNSSHLGISYAVFCLKKKIQKTARWWQREIDT